MPLNINLLSDDTIARGITPPDVGNFGTALAGTQDYLQKQQLQNLFSGGLPKDPQGNIDYKQMAEMLARASGAAAIPTLAALRQADIQQQALTAAGGLGGVFGTPSQTQQPLPPLPPSIQRTTQPRQQTSDVEAPQGGGVPRPPGQNVTSDTEVPGSARMSVDGGPEQPIPSFASRFAGEPTPAVGDTRYPPQFGQAPDTGPPTDRLQVAQAQPQPQRQMPPQTTRPLITDPNQPGYWTLENAANHDRAAARANQASTIMGIGGLEKASPGYLQQGKQLSDRAQQIYEHISKDTAATPEMRNAAASGLKTPTQYEEVTAQSKKAGELFATRYEGINKAGAEAAAELPQLQVAQRLMDDPKFMSGVGESANLTYKRLLAQFGGDPNAAVPQEAFRKLISNSLLESMRTMQGTGPTRVATIKIMQQAAASPENSVAANRLLVGMNARMQQRMMNIAELAQTYNGGRLDAGFDRKVQQYDQQDPLFTSAEIKDPRLIAPPLFRTPQDAMYSGQPRGTPFRTPSGEIRYIP